MNSDDLFFATTLVGSGAFTGVVTYALTGRDLRGRGRLWVSLLSAVLVGAMCLLIPYLPMLAFLVALVAYRVMRILLSPRHAVAASAVVLFGGLSSAVLVMGAALNSM
jgi:hypothetical protein